MNYNAMIKEAAMYVRRFFIGLLLMTFMLVSARMSHAITFAQFALGGGYETLILITNKTASNWSGTIYLSQGYNQKWQSLWAMNGQVYTGLWGVPITLGPLECRKLRFTGDDITRSGYLEIDAESYYSEFDIAVSYFYEFRINGELITTTGGIESAFNNKAVVAVEKTATVDTGIAWCPASRYGSIPFEMYLTLYNQSGDIVRQKTITFIGHSAKFLSAIFADLPTNFLGHLRIDAQNYFWLEAIRFESTSNYFQLTSTPPDDNVP